MGTGEQEHKEYEKELQKEKKAEAEFENKLRTLRKERNKQRLMKETTLHPRKKQKIDEENAFISIRNSWGQPPPSAPKKHTSNQEENTQLRKKQRIGETLTNIVTLEDRVIEGESISEFEIVNINWEEHLENHRIRIETEAKEREKQIEKKEKKEKSWELYNRCKNFLEENDKDWEKRKIEREIEKKKIERLSLANSKQENLRMKVKERKLAEEINKGLETMPTDRRNKLEQEENRKRKQELIETKKSLWKLRGKEKKKIIRKSEHVEKLEKLEKMEEKLYQIEKILEEVKEQDRKKKEEQRERKSKEVAEWRKKLRKKEEKEKQEEKERIISERWAIQKWITKFIDDNVENWEKEKLEREIENRKEIEHWNKLKRIEKINLLKRKWAEEKTEITSKQFSKEKQQHVDIIFPEEDVVNNIPLSVLQGDDVQGGVQEDEQLLQDVHAGSPDVEVSPRPVVQEGDEQRLQDVQLGSPDVGVLTDSTENKQQNQVLRKPEKITTLKPPKRNNNPKKKITSSSSSKLIKTPVKNKKITDMFKKITHDCESSQIGLNSKSGHDKSTLNISTISNILETTTTPGLAKTSKSNHIDNNLVNKFGDQMNQESDYNPDASMFSCSLRDQDNTLLLNTYADSYNKK